MCVQVRMWVYACIYIWSGLWEGQAENSLIKMDARKDMYSGRKCCGIFGVNIANYPNYSNFLMGW